MFENRAKGAQLVKRIAYFYLIVAILIAIAIAVMKVDIFSTNILCYIIMFPILYLLSTKFKDNKNTWIFVVICAIITLVLTLKPIGLILAILSIVAANDMRKELN